MSEFMGLISGAYEAKEEGFGPGGAALHSIMTPHGPGAQCFKQATECEFTTCRVAENSMVNIVHLFSLHHSENGSSFRANILEESLFPSSGVHV